MKTKTRQQLMIWAFIIGVAAIALTLATLRGEGQPHIMRYYATILFALFAAQYVNAVMASVGSWLGGLIGGFQLYRWQIGGSLFVKRDGRWHKSPAIVPGLISSCYMVNRDEGAAYWRYACYYLGGIVLNMMFALAAYLAYALLPLGTVGLLGLMVYVIITLFGTVMTLVPRKSAGAYGALALLKWLRDPQTRKADHWAHICSVRIISGTRWRDLGPLPMELTQGGSAPNVVTDGIAYMRGLQLLDEGRCDEGYAQLRALFEQDAPYYPPRLNGARATLLIGALIAGDEPDEIERLHSAGLMKYAAAARHSPAFLLMRYACALLIDHDEAQAQSLLREFHRASQQSPFIGEHPLNGDMLQRIQFRYEEVQHELSSSASPSA